MSNCPKTHGGGKHLSLWIANYCLNVPEGVSETLCYLHKWLPACLHQETQDNCQVNTLQFKMINGLKQNKKGAERCNWCINQRRTDTSIKLKNCPLIPTLMPLYPAQDWDNSKWTVWPIRPKVFMVVSILLEFLMPSEVMRQKPQPWKSNISHYPWLTGSLWLQWGAVPASWSLLCLAGCLHGPLMQRQHRDGGGPCLWRAGLDKWVQTSAHGVHDWNCCLSTQQKRFCHLKCTSCGNIQINWIHTDLFITSLAKMTS